MNFPLESRTWISTSFLKIGYIEFKNRRVAADKIDGKTLLVAVQSFRDGVVDNYECNFFR